MALSTEGFDLLDVILQDRRLCTLVVAVELREVVNLHIVRDSVGESGWSAEIPRH